MTKHFPRNARQSFGRKYRVLMETCPDMATECGVFAGIQTARSGGTTQTPCLVDRVIGDKDQMDVHCRSAVPTVSKVLDFVHGPDNNESMERRQAFRFQLMPNGEQ